MKTTVAEALKELDAAEEKLLLAAGWQHARPHGWRNPKLARVRSRLFSRSEAVLETRRQILLEQIRRG